MEIDIVVLKAGVPSHNGNVYPREQLEKMLEDPVLQDHMDKDVFFGMLGEDACTNPMDLSKASHRVKKLWLDGDDLYARVELLDTPRGEQARALVTEASVGLRGCTSMYATAKQEGEEYVVDKIDSLIRVDLQLKEDWGWRKYEEEE